MDFDELTRQLSQQQPPTPQPAQEKTQAPAAKPPCLPCTLKQRMQEAASAKASLVAVWTVDEAGKITYSCHRHNFPVDDLQATASQFEKDQFAEYVKCLAREAVKP